MLKIAIKIILGINGGIKGYRAMLLPFAFLTTAFALAKFKIASGNIIATKKL